MDRVPDALMIRQECRRGVRLRDRIDSIADLAEPLLAVDRAAAQRTWIRMPSNGWLFVTRDPHDTINYPTDHPRSGAARYTWEAQPDGIQFGYLKPEAL